MAELSIPEAAQALGVHSETIRRRIRRGELQARRDQHGRFLVDLPDFPDAQSAAPLTQRVRSDHADNTRAYTELTRQRDALAEQLESVRTDLAAEREAGRELRVLLLRQSEQLSIAQQQVQALLPAPREEQQTTEAQEPEQTQPQRRPVWRRWTWPKRA